MACEEAMAAVCATCPAVCPPAKKASSAGGLELTQVMGASNSPIPMEKPLDHVLEEKVDSTEALTEKTPVVPFAIEGAPEGAPVGAPSASE